MKQKKIYLNKLEKNFIEILQSSLLRYLKREVMFIDKDNMEENLKCLYPYLFDVIGSINVSSLENINRYCFSLKKRNKKKFYDYWKYAIDKLYYFHKIILLNVNYRVWIYFPIDIAKRY